jgi:Uma2 family endonuclease
MSTDVVDLAALLGDDPTFDENDEPLASQHHRNVIDSLYYTLRERLAGPEIAVAAELRIYRDLQAVAARNYREPDVLVAPGRPDYERLIYLLNEERHAPAFALEVLSDTTWTRDLGEKRRWYAGIGVREYIVVDLEGRYTGERRLQRWRLQEGADAMVAPADVGLEGEVIASTVLPYGLVVRAGWVRLVDQATGEELPLLREQLAQGRREADLRRAAQAEALVELERRLAAEARQREAEARQREAEQQAAAAASARLAEVQRRREAEERALAETAARRAAEEEITRLRRALQRSAELDEEHC